MERHTSIPQLVSGVWYSATTEGVKHFKMQKYEEGHQRVLFIASVFRHLAIFHIPFMKLLQSRGYNVHAAASTAEGFRETVEAAGVKCWDVSFGRSPFSPANIRAYRQLRDLLETNRFDLIHVHTPVAAFLGRYVAKATNQGPVLYTAHGFHFYKGAPLRNWLIYGTAERLAARWTDGLIVMNDEDHDVGKRLGFVPGKNLFYVHGVGVDLQHFGREKAAGRLRQELRIPATAAIITCVAEFTPRKNHKELLRAFRGLFAKDSRVHLVLVGTGSEEDAIHRYVAQKRIANVHFLGFRHDIPEILADSDIVTLVSKHEGLPRCIMEAMAVGKPVVATNVRGNRDLVEHGRTGFLVELGDVEGLTRALEQLIADPELRTRMGEAARQKIQDYSLDRVLDEMEEIYGRYLKW